MDTARVRTRTIWVAAAGVFGIAVVASLVSGSPILAILLLVAAVGCVLASRRVAPDADGTTGGDEDPTRDEEHQE